MLQTFLIYQLKVFICATLLMGYYRLALRNKRFHYYNRFYLLMIVLFSITVPLLNLQWFTFESNNEKAFRLLNVIYANSEEEKINESGNLFLDWQQLILIAMAIVTFIILIVLASRIWKIYRIKRNYPVRQTNEFDFIETDLRQAPFSFLKNIFWRNDISLEEAAGRQILQHEITHIQQKHTWDKLFMQILNSVFWMNPVFWVIQRELYLIHEFIADEKAVEDKDAAAFATMLLHAHYGQSIFVPAQSFFYSPIKRRLIMLTTSKEPRFSYFRRIMALPLLAFITFLFAFRIQKSGNENITLTKINAPFKLVVDAGHGGKDIGAVGINGIQEKDINLTISKRIKELSAEYGIDVILTRANDVFMSPSEKVDFSNKQEADAFISIHANMKQPGFNGNAGMEVLISPDNSKYNESKLLGSAVVQSLDQNFNVVKALIQSKTGIWILKTNTKPSILVECGYLDNPADVELVNDPAKTELIARKILEGIAAYANNKDITTYDVKSLGMESAPDTAAPKPTPLYVLDGTIINQEKMKSLNTDNIKSVVVLKDKNATDKYGDKGKNGVVEIYTKNGESYNVNKNNDTNNANNANTEGAVNKELKNPLFVINGKISAKAEADKLDPNNIKSVNVLKDKSATDKYGEKGKNGVIEIITNGLIRSSGFDSQRDFIIPRKRANPGGGDDC